MVSSSYSMLVLLNGSTYIKLRQIIPNPSNKHAAQCTVYRSDAVAVAKERCKQNPSQNTFMAQIHWK